MTDTAEYWWDVKQNKSWVGRTTFYHIPNALCGHKHYHEAKKLGNVNCYACLELIKNGYQHNLEEGTYLTHSQRKRKAAENKQKLFNEKHGKCSCGSRWTIRKNKTSGQEFLGCSNYPNCKNTKTL